MAVTIVRSVWIDDDGTGTTGTVINQALHTALYNEIDGALAKVAQLSGGNTFSGGNQAFTGGGVVFVNTVTNFFSAQMVVASDLTAHQGLAVQNLSATNSGNFMYFYNSANVAAGSISQSGATTVVYGTTSDARLKDDDGRATDLDALRAIVVHEFTWKAGGRDRGVFAQELAPLFPRAVVEGTDETTAAGTLARPWMTDYSKIVPDLIVGWQQHDAELAEIRAGLAAVTGSAVSGPALGGSRRDSTRGAA